MAQLKTNVARLRALSGNLGDRYVMVNIPAAQVEAVENGVAVARYTAVVGRPDRPSPDVNSKITEINFNPYWTVPVSLVRRDLVPLMQKDPNYLTSEHIHIYDGKGNELQPSQHGVWVPGLLRLRSVARDDGHAGLALRFISPTYCA